jgi:hypothetical protein
MEKKRMHFMQSWRVFDHLRKGRVFLIVGTILQVSLASKAQALPMFARKYKVDCVMCHAAVPRLNFTGTKFKVAGYRMPWEISKDQEKSTAIFENYNSFVGIINAPIQMHVSSNTTPTNVQINAQELDLHPLTGSWGKYWGTRFELDAFPSGTVSLNEAFLTFTAGSSDSFGTVQAGVMPNFLGYGILDRPIGVTAPLILASSAGNPTLNTLYSMNGPRASGLTGSYWLGDALFSASVRNHLTPAGGGLDGIVKSTSSMGDVLLSGSYFFNHTGAGSAITPYYYRGQSQVPTVAGGSTLYPNNFNRLGLALNNYFTDNWNAFAGYGWGQDQFFDLGLNLITGNQYSQGLYAGG